MFTIECDIKFEKVVLSKMSIDDAISRIMFSKIEFFTITEPEQRIISKKIRCEMVIDGNKKFVNGIISDFSYSCDSYSFSGEKLFRVNLTIYSHLFLLQFNQKNRIFSDISISEVISEIAKPYGIKIDVNISQNPTQNFLPQYNETDFNFLMRLLSDNSLFFYHDKNGICCFADNYSKIEDTGSVKYSSYSDNNSIREIKTISQITKKLSSSLKSSSVNFFQFKKPDEQLSYKEASSISNSIGEMSFDLSGCQISSSDNNSPIKNKCKSFLDQSNSCSEIYTCSGSIFIANVGNFMQVDNCFIDGFNRKYFIISNYEEFIYQDDQEIIYHQKVQMVEDNKIFINKMPHERLAMPLLHTAIVAGGSPGQINSDPEGRIQVQFHWDENNKNNGWWRVATPAAYKNTGFASIPRVGTEVMMARIGECDFIVLSSLFGANNSFPRDSKSKSESWSSLEGESGKTNEICFDIENGTLKIFAEKDLSIVGKNINIEGDNISIKGNKKVLTSCGGSESDVSAGIIKLKSSMIKLN